MKSNKASATTLQGRLAYLTELDTVIPSRDDGLSLRLCAFNIGYRTAMILCDYYTSTSGKPHKDIKAKMIAALPNNCT